MLQGMKESVQMVTIGFPIKPSGSFDWSKHKKKNYFLFLEVFQTVRLDGMNLRRSRTAALRETLCSDLC